MNLDGVGDIPDSIGIDFARMLLLENGEKTSALPANANRRMLAVSKSPG
jgi:hypothetical protein